MVQVHLTMNVVTEWDGKIIFKLLNCIFIFKSYLLSELGLSGGINLITFWLSLVIESVQHFGLAHFHSLGVAYHFAYHLSTVGQLLCLH